MVDVITEGFFYAWVFMGAMEDARGPSGDPSFILSNEIIGGGCPSDWCVCAV